MFSHTHIMSGFTVLVVLAIGHSAAVMAADPAIIEEGEKLYNQNCGVCHQADAIGQAGFAPSLTNKELLSMASDKFFEGTEYPGFIPFEKMPNKRKFKQEVE